MNVESKNHGVRDTKCIFGYFQSKRSVECISIAIVLACTHCIHASCDWPIGRRLDRTPGKRKTSELQLPRLLNSPFTLPWHDIFTSTASPQGRMLKLVLRSPSLSELRPPSAAGRSFTSSLRRSLAHPRHGILKEPWLPPLSPAPLPTTYFSPSRVRRGLDGLDSSPQNDHKPPDERILKLGKSKNATRSLHFLLRIWLADRVSAYCSSTNALASSPNHTVQYTTPRDPRTDGQSPPLSLHTPTPPYRQRPNIVSRSTMDSASSMEQCSATRECEATDTE